MPKKSKVSKKPTTAKTTKVSKVDFLPPYTCNGQFVLDRNHRTVVVGTSPEDAHNAMVAMNDYCVRKKIP